jgi:plastocyanin
VNRDEQACRRKYIKRLLLLVVLSVIAILMFVPPVGAQEAGVESVPVQDARSVGIGDNFFDPPDVAIEPGTTITWTNNGALPHTVTADDGSFDSGVLNPGDSFTVAFDGQGTVTYFCAIHPEMRGSVTVGGGADGPAEQPASEDMAGGMGAGGSY